MKRIERILFLFTMAAFAAGIFAGIWRFGIPQFTTTVRIMDSTWTYTTDTGLSGTVRLPDVLDLPKGTTEVRLTADLPEWTGEAYAIHFISVEQSVEVWIDNERRYQYGAEPDAEDFVFQSARQINQVMLKKEDSGRKITIIYRSPPLFLAELGILREVKIAAAGDLVLNLLADSMPVTLISFFTVLTILMSLLILAIYRDVPLRENICMLFQTAVTIFYYNSENSIFYSVFHHSAAYSSLKDWTFYYLEPMIQFTAWFTLYVCGWKLQTSGRRVLSVFGTVYIAAAVLSLAGVFNFNLTRPFFMIAGMIFTVFWMKNWIRNRQKEYFGYSEAVLILLAGYALDYIRYCLMILPASMQWSVFLHVELPFQFFTGIALTIFSVLVLRETMKRVAKHKSDIQVEAASSQLLVEYARQQYESIVQRDISLRSMKHDMQFYFRTAAVMLADGQTAEAQRYLAELGNTVAALRISSWCADYVANITIGWYADQFQQRNIPFSVTADIPEIREAVHPDINCILSNALQNALEGCEDCEEAFVTLSARPKGDELLLRIENRCSSKMCEADGFCTTKTEEGHGFGIASMKAAVKRQSGYFKAHAKGGIFCIDIIVCDVFASKS